MSYEMWCKNFNGIQNKICKAGVKYEDVKGDDRRPLNYPCFKDMECTVVCPHVAFRTPEEVAEEEEKSRQVVQAYLDNLKNDICPHCHTPIAEQYQVGRCAYAKPCGCRLFQGTAKKKPGQSESPSQNTLFNDA
jgi:hypothetical protein